MQSLEKQAPKTQPSTSTEAPLREHHFTVNSEDEAGDFQRLRGQLAAQGVQPLSLFIFGGHDGVASCDASGLGAGVSWLQGDSSSRSGISSLQAFAVSGGRPVRVIRRGQGVGFVYEDEVARYCRLAAVMPSRRDRSREDQAREVFEAAEMMLHEGGFSFCDTVRTWFYLDRLLEWYAGFNSVRTSFFRSRGVFERLVPASTGIGAGNASGSALTCDLLAIQPRDGMSIRAVPSPLQDSALTYQSSFSRAVEITTPATRQLLVSGTASLDKAGRSVHAGDAAAQIGLTLDVVEALLKSRGMDWAHVTRGIAYFRNLAARPLLEECFRKRGVGPVSLAMAEADICRDDLLFEIEVDAIRR